MIKVRVFSNKVFKLGYKVFKLVYSFNISVTSRSVTFTLLRNNTELGVI